MKENKLTYVERGGERGRECRKYKEGERKRKTKKKVRKNMLRVNMRNVSSKLFLMTSVESLGKHNNMTL